MRVEICRKKRWSRNLRRFWDLATLHSMILPMPNSFRLFAMGNRFHAKSRFRFITNREGEPAGMGTGRGEMLGRDFFERDPLSCARDLVGCELNWNSCAGVIVETEAYNAIGDEACHCFVRPSTRAFVERNHAGAAYVYFNYGVHWMLNVLVKGKENGFVLIRALEPT